jgi:hypothetical protein
MDRRVSVITFARLCRQGERETRQKQQAEYTSHLFTLLWGIGSFYVRILFSRKGVEFHVVGGAPDPDKSDGAVPI